MRLLTWIHGDKYSAGRFDRNVISVENESFLFGGERWQHAQNLLSDNWQDFDVDSIELVEAAPRPRLRQAWKMEHIPDNVKSTLSTSRSARLECYICGGMC